SLLYRGLSLSGIFVLVGLAALISVNRRGIQWRPVIWGLGLQFALGLLLLNPFIKEVFSLAVNDGVAQLLYFSDQGAEFVFGTQLPHTVGDGAGGEIVVGGGKISPPVRNIAFVVLPTIIFFSSLMSVLYHLGVMQRLVLVIAWVMQRTMRTSGAESLSAAANIFVGQTEAPLVVKPYINEMTRSELHAIMTGGFATVAGGVLAAYVQFLKTSIPDIAGHLVVASILSAPAALAISKIIYPEDGTPVTSTSLNMTDEKTARNVLEAAANGAVEGVRLAINVAAMLIAFIALIKMVDWTLGLVPIAFCESGVAFGYPDTCEPLSLTKILGWVFAPLAFAMGVPWSEAGIVGTLLGEKLVLTEFVAYLHLGQILTDTPEVLSQRSAIIASYALCGFANFASIGIQLGGIGGIAPNRMGDLSEMGIRAMIGGSLAAFMTATVAGVLLT
ncbi:MAG: nucleoside transporter C-terminal domain-containing protein, partial [Myxococcota bacterium]